MTSEYIWVLEDILEDMVKGSAPLEKHTPERVKADLLGAVAERLEALVDEVAATREVLLNHYEGRSMTRRTEFRGLNVPSPLCPACGRTMYGESDYPFPESHPAVTRIIYFCPHDDCPHGIIPVTPSSEARQ